MLGAALKPSDRPVQVVGTICVSGSCAAVDTRAGIAVVAVFFRQQIETDLDAKAPVKCLPKQPHLANLAVDASGWYISPLMFAELRLGRYKADTDKCGT